MAEIKKIQICSGVSWVEIAGVNLRLLCGCPADSVKHLTKRGLINTVENNAQHYESGPNAILLSDVTIQNGQFCNLAEFPVLQMLYKQGMLIPGHPNNTGAKPKLIGKAKQIESQLRYIYRGNYGLISKEELEEAGYSGQMLEDVWQMKMRFAFGAIKPPEEFVEAIKVECDEAVEVAEGVQISRIKTNHYEITYAGESVMVDMNLKTGETYPTPYQLNYHDTKREYFAVIHSGNGDGWDQNNPVMSSIITYQGKVYLVDAGPNLLANLVALGIGVEEIEGVFHTHSHDDHFAGLPVLIRSDHKIKYFSTKPVRIAVVKKLCALLDIAEEDFELYFEIHDLMIDHWNDVEGLEIKPVFSPHPVETNYFVFRTLSDNGYLSFSHMADIVSLDVLEKMQKNEARSGVSEEFIEKVKKDYLEKVDIKKIDVGGGMIHGEALDFKNDFSGKIILSHTSRIFSNAEKNIGSGAPFGATDVLIPAHPNSRDFFWQEAKTFLKSYFPSAPANMLKNLLNSPVKTHNPEAILIREGEASKVIYLLLTGFAEMINVEQNIRSTLSAGAMIGDFLTCGDNRSTITYRAMSYLNTLAIPCSLFTRFIRQNNLYEEMALIQDYRIFLQNHWLFGESISFNVQNTIAKAMKNVTYPKGEQVIEKDTQFLSIIVRGRLIRMLGEYEIDYLSEGECYGEESVVQGDGSIHHFRAENDVEVYRIPGEILKEIPIVRWKLFELSRKRNNIGN